MIYCDYPILKWDYSDGYVCIPNGRKSLNKKESENICMEKIMKKEWIYFVAGAGLMASVMTFNMPKNPLMLLIAKQLQ